MGRGGVLVRAVQQKLSHRSAFRTKVAKRITGTDVTATRNAQTGPVTSAILAACASDSESYYKRRRSQMTQSDIEEKNAERRVKDQKKREAQLGTSIAYIGVVDKFVAWLAEHPDPEVVKAAAARAKELAGAQAMIPTFLKDNAALKLKARSAHQWRAQVLSRVHERGSPLTAKSQVPRLRKRRATEAQVQQGLQGQEQK